MEELKLAAIARGLMVIRKRKTGPIMIMESRTGKSFGTFADLDAATAAVFSIPPLPVEAPPEAVGWHSDVEYITIPRACSNGWGPGCLCLDTTALYLCAAPPCRFRAECQGACRAHYSQLKVFGDLTRLAIKKTADLAEQGEFDLENLPVYPRITSLKTVIQTARYPTSFTPSEIIKITSGVIGMSIRWTGAEYLLVDKDGHVLDRVTSKEALFEEEDEDEGNVIIEDVDQPLKEPGQED